MSQIIFNKFLDMVGSFPTAKRDKLYHNAITCKFILRCLPGLAKHTVLRLSYIVDPLSLTDLERSINTDGNPIFRVAMDRLVQIGILMEMTDGYRLNTTFQSNIQKNIITNSIDLQSMKPNNIELPIEEINKYALEQWECFLLQIIKANKGEELTGGVTSSMTRIFPSLTGLQFLLMDHESQLWYILREYISKVAQEGDFDETDVISCLAELSVLITGQGYDLNTLTEVQRITVKDFAALGLVKLSQGREDSWFTPTVLATRLSVSLADPSVRRPEGYIKVEANLKMYAYTGSELQAEILGLFSKIECRFANLVVARITRESLYNAYGNGITSDQIILFLQQNSHPTCPLIPEVVTEQIRVWEKNLKRIEMTDAYLADDFPSKDKFDGACASAREWGALLFEDSENMRLVVHSRVQNQMQEFLVLP